MKVLLICLGAIASMVWHSAHAQQFNLYCLTGTSSTGAASWAPASSTTPCPVTSSGGGGGAVTQSSQAGSATGNTWFFQGAGSAGTNVGGVLTIQGNASGVAVPVSQSGTWTAGVTQATAASLNATVVGTGTFAVQAAESGTWTNTVTQTTAANLNATVVNGGTFAVQGADKVGGNTSTDGSTTITTGGTAQNLFSGSTPAHGFEVCNPGATDDLWVSDSTTAAANNTGSYRVGANGGCYVTPLGRLPIQAVSVVAATTGDKITARSW